MLFFQLDQKRCKLYNKIEFRTFHRKAKNLFQWPEKMCFDFFVKRKIVIRNSQLKNWNKIIIINIWSTCLLFAACWSYHWQRWQPNQTDSAAVERTNTDRWSYCRVQWQDHYYHGQSRANSKCPILAAAEVIALCVHASAYLASKLLLTKMLGLTAAFLC